MMKQLIPNLWYADKLNQSRVLFVKNRPIINRSFWRQMIEILRDKTMDDKLIYIPNDDKQNYPYLKLVPVNESCFAFIIKLFSFSHRVKIFKFHCFFNYLWFNKFTTNKQQFFVLTKGREGHENGLKASFPSVPNK